MTICDICLEDVDWADVVYKDGDVQVCELCWKNEKVKKRVRERRKLYKKIGHTGEDMCGCSMCARQYEIDHGD